MDKYIGFDIDSKKVAVCIVESGKHDINATITSDVKAMRQFLLSQRQEGSRQHLAYEVSGYSGYLYDELCECVDTITVSNPTKTTWIYRTAKKSDRIDARKLAVLLSMKQFRGHHIMALT